MFCPVTVRVLGVEFDSDEVNRGAPAPNWGGAGPTEGTLTLTEEQAQRLAIGDRSGFRLRVEVRPR